MEASGFRLLWVQLFFESNLTVLKNYMSNNTEVTSFWVGSFEALLPWIEIRGCYDISLIRNILNRDEYVAENSPFCQMKCMNRRYFAFIQKDETCVCFDEHEVVKRESDNASFCQECTNQGDCSSNAIVYKGDGRRADTSTYLQFAKYRSSCEENHFSYPLLHSVNPVKLCNLFLEPGVDVLVGVYRQTLYIDNLEKTGNRSCETEY
ncbi:unnamed protein product [Mytilus coruscus]|uniref:WSC domain-containing protein n=1 Tax=Mytilus coruscus TaxID=42192 RepID=A0A6J8C705_MYTCO|nr:unnamed protein product [Mytilus coruscus]